MPAKIVLCLLTLVLVSGGAALTLTGNVALIVVGVLLVLLGAIFGGTALSLMRDPESAAERLTARRSQLEARAGKVSGRSPRR